MLTFVYSYYRNTTMFQLQQRVWNDYHIDKDIVQVIVTDDCSPEEEAIEKAIITPKYPNMRVFKILKKVPWNWLECRNIGAHYAENDWILLTDMDHVVSYMAIQRILEEIPHLSYWDVHQFTRVRPDGTPYKPHNDSFLISKDLFWKCGGYDEHYSGLYGTSGMFKRRLLSFAVNVKTLQIPLILYGRHVVLDASTTDFPRKENRDPNAIQKRSLTSPGIELHFQQPYTELVFDGSSSGN